MLVQLLQVAVARLQDSGSTRRWACAGIKAITENGFFTALAHRAASRHREADLWLQLVLGHEASFIRTIRASFEEAHHYQMEAASEPAGASRASSSTWQLKQERDGRMLRVASIRALLGTLQKVGS